jgi:hypothetical protein
MIEIGFQKIAFSLNPPYFSGYVFSLPSRAPLAAAGNNKLSDIRLVS